jgi:hypothetical protein
VTDIAPHVESAPGAGLEKSQQTNPLPLSPEERLKRKIGPRAYAEAMAALRYRLRPLSSP